MTLHLFDNGDRMERREKALITHFAGLRRVLSTSPFNGGLRDDLHFIFNQDCKENGNKHAPLKAPTYEEHMRLVAADLGLDPERACGLSTAADMENAAVCQETYDNLTVTAIVTGGIDVNGGRAGDPATWHEGTSPASGTINILLFFSVCLPEWSLTRALITCTEAKTAALQELLAPSMYSSGLATGSGTDGIILVSDLSSPVTLTYAGKHSKLGELIGRTVKTAVKRALELQTGLNAAQQHDVFSRCGRYGITREQVFQHCPDSAEADRLAKTPELVIITSLYVHLLDQLTWGLITPESAAQGAAALLKSDKTPEATLQALIACLEHYLLQRFC